MKNNKLGFTLVEVLIVTAIVGAVSMAIVSLMSGLNKAQSQASFYSDVEMLKSSIRLVTENRHLCKGALLDAAGDKQVYNPGSQDFVQQFAEIKSGLSVRAKVGEINQGVKITGLSLKPYGNWSPTFLKETMFDVTGTQLIEYNKHFVTLTVNMDAPKNSKSRHVDFDMVVLTDTGTNKIEECYTYTTEREILSKKPPIRFQLGDKATTSSGWVCKNDVDLSEYCGDENGCRVTGTFAYKPNSYDQVGAFSYVIYMEQPSTSNNSFPGVYGSVMDAYNYTNTPFISGNSNYIYNLMSPWNVFYMMTYNYEYCGVPRESLPAYHFSFMAHPDYILSVEISDRPFP